MYVLRFIRRDRQPAEEYFYNTESDAMYHMALFEDDDSGLYRRIELVKILSADTENIIKTIRYMEGSR